VRLIGLARKNVGIENSGQRAASREQGAERREQRAERREERGESREQIAERRERRVHTQQYFQYAGGGGIGGDSLGFKLTRRPDSVYVCMHVVY
jgi:hypothetical protein